MRSSSSSPCLREDEALDLVDRIRLTKPIWHRTATNRAAAVHLLLNKPPGTFIIRDAIERKDACLMLSMVISSHPKTQVSHDPIHESSHQERPQFHLANSKKTFQDLTSLVVFYCSNGNSDEQLPHLVLPKEILEAKTHQRLLALADLGHYFWVPSLFGRSHSLPEEVSASVTDRKMLDASRRAFHASQRSLCSTPSSESIVPSLLTSSDGEETIANESRSVGHESRSTSADGSGTYHDDLLRIPDGIRRTSSDERSGYVSSSESGSDIINGMIYYRSNLPDKLSDYEDIWPSPSSFQPPSNALPCDFPVSHMPSSPPRLPTPFTVNRSLSSPVSLLFSSQYLNPAWSNQFSLAERQMLTSSGPVAAAADVHCTRTSQTQREVSRIDLTKYRLNREETGAKKNLPLMGFPQQPKFPRQGCRVRSKKSALHHGKSVQGGDADQHQQQENYNFKNVTKIECHRLETTGVFHFDFQQTSRLASHVSKVTQDSPHHLTSPDYALPYDALPCNALLPAASFNGHCTSQSQRYLFQSLINSSHRTLASAPLHPRNPLAPNCNHDNRNDATLNPLNLDFRNTAYYKWCRNNNASAMTSKTENDESRIQRVGIRPTVSDPQHCFRDVMKPEDDETMMEFGYRLPFDAVSFQMNPISNNQGVGQPLPSHPHRASQPAAAALNSIPGSGQAEHGSIEEVHDDKGMLPRKKSLRASFSSIQKKILRVNQKKPQPHDSFSRAEKTKTDTSSAVPLVTSHFRNGESRLSAGATTTVTLEDETIGSSSSLRRHAFQLVNLKRRRSVYDNVCTPSHHPLLNPGDIPRPGDISPDGDRYGGISPYGDRNGGISPYGDRHSDISLYGDDSLTDNRRLTTASQMTTATEYCQPWETIRWSQLLDQNFIHNSSLNRSVETQCNHPNPIHNNDFVQRSSVNDHCTEAGKVVDSWNHFQEESNGTKDVSKNSDRSKFVPSKSKMNQTNSSDYLCTTDNGFSMSGCTRTNLKCNLANDSETRFNDSAAKENADCVVKSKVMICRAVPISDSGSTADANHRISNDKMLCCSGNASRNSFSGSHNNQNNNQTNDQETLLAPMSPDVIPQSASLQQEPSPVRGKVEDGTTATRIYNYIIQMSQRREGFFGKMVQSFIECTRNATEKNPKNVVRNVRQFMTGLKNYLIQHGEDDLNDFIRSESGKMNSSEFLNLDVILERAFEDCIVHPLQGHIYQLFVLAYKSDGQLQSMSDGIKFARKKTSFAELGLPLGSSCERATGDALHFLTMMENSHSPTRKFLFLQAAITRVINSENETSEDSESRQSVKNTEGHVSSLVRVLVEKGLVSAQIELDYIQGLMDMTSSVTSEGSYHLGLISCAVELIKNMNKNRPLATNNNSSSHNTAAILSDALLAVYVPDEKFNNAISVKIPLRQNSVAKDICDMMAYKMRVTNPQDYGLFLLTDGTEIRLLDLTKISEFLLEEKVKASATGSPFRLIYKRINAKFIWPRNR